MKKISKKYHQYFEECELNKIKNSINNGMKFINIDFFDIAKFDVNLSQTLLNNPVENFEIMGEVLKQFFEEYDDENKLRVHLTSLPDSNKLFIRDIRSSTIEKLVLVEGQIRRKTDVRPRIKESHYLCTNPSCSYSEEKLIVPQIEEKLKILKSCPKCKSSTSLINKILIDSQTLVLEEIPEKLKNQSDQPKRMNILLEEDLTTPFKDSKTNPGSKIKVIGIIKEVPKITRSGAQSVNYDLIIFGNHIKNLDDDSDDVKTSKEEENKIIELTKKENVMEILVKNFAPSIYGNECIKESILLQMIGGTREVKKDGVVVRGDIHILLVGDPGAAKSQLLKSAARLSSRSSYVSGKSASGVGLTASVVKDDLVGGWALEAGAMVFSNGGVCCIDEMDKMDTDDTSAMHEALEQQTISIAKANIKATLRCETSVLGAANPKFGRFNPFEDISKQIDFPPALLSRFDLIFILRDIPKKDIDRAIAKHILETHKNIKDMKIDLDTNFLRKFIHYIKKITPRLTDESIEILKEFYINMRSMYIDENEDEEKLQPIPITARQLEALIRLSQAYARLNLSKKVEKRHAIKAIELLEFYLEKMGLDPKTGKIDIDRISVGITQSQRDEFKVVKDIIDNLKEKYGKIEKNKIFSVANEKKIKRFQVEKILKKLREDGIIHEPKKGEIRKLE